MRELYKRAAPHIDSVRLDGGVPTDNVQELLLLKRSNEELKDVLRLSYCPELHGNKIRTSGINNFIAKGYDEATSNDLTQTSSASQPFLDKIAPTEKLSAKNPNGAACYLTHTPIIFGNTDKWTAEIVVNWSGKSISSSHAFLFGSGNAGTYVGVNAGNVNMFTPVGISSSFIIGKTYTICYVKTVNSIILYVDGVYKGISVFDTTFTMSVLNSGYNFNNNCDGNIFSYHIFSDALNAQQVAERASVLRSIFPEIPFTRIGDQIWSVRNCEMAATPQGNTIPEVQANGNVEKVVNGGFEGAKVNTDSGNHTSSIVYDSALTSNVLEITATGGGNYSTNRCVWANGAGLNSALNTSTSKWHKISFKAKSISGSLSIRVDDTGAGYNSSIAITTSWVTYTMYYLHGVSGGGVNIFSQSSAGVFRIDEFSFQEIGWSGSQELYDGIYAQTSGTVEQKTYAAAKAAAMWCHFNNDATLGATYGKLYNWFAVKLMQMDIDYYNAANPATPWGWRVPTQADFSTLATTLGGIAVAGGKMKLNDSRYWISPNVGADNSSSFSAIGGGIRMEDGTNFATYPTGSLGTYHTLTEETQTTATIASTSNLHPQLTLVGTSKIRGRSLRLIKTT